MIAPANPMNIPAPYCSGYPVAACQPLMYITAPTQHTMPTTPAIRVILRLKIDAIPRINAIGHSMSSNSAPANETG